MRNLLLIFVLAASLLPFATVLAAPADLPKTGQTSCTNSSGTVIACAGTGQDGDRQAGMAWPVPRFVVGTGTEANCVTDQLTGLMWVRAPDSIPADNWPNALTFANSLTLCGFSDWRLPNLNELVSLTNSGAMDQAGFLNAQGFSGVQPAEYWSSSTYAGAANYAWDVNMSDGSVNNNGKSINIYVWPVRTGQ